MRISDWSSDVCSSDLRIEPMHAVFDIDQFDLRARKIDRRRQDVETRQLGRDHRLLDGGLPHQQFIAGDFAVLVVDAKRSEEHTSELQSLMRISHAVFSLKNTNGDNTFLFSVCYQHK